MGWSNVSTSGGKPPIPILSNDYAEFYSTLNQTANPSSIYTVVSLENTTMSQGIAYIGDGTIEFINSGKYMINVTYQITNPTGFGDYAHFFLIKNGVNMPSTTRVVRVTGDQVVTLTYMVNILGDDRITFAWAVEEYNTTLISHEYPFYPNSPSVLAQVFQISPYGGIG